VAAVIPEMPFDEAATIARMKQLKAAGKRGFVVVVSEGVRTSDGKPYSEALAEVIAKETLIETKFARFAHVVRGGKPSLQDRLIATEMGVRAVDLLLAGQSNKVICRIDGKIVPVDINYALITDRYYKNKLKEGDLDAFTPDQVAAMKARAAQLHAEIENVYRMIEDTSK